MRSSLHLSAIFPFYDALMIVTSVGSIAHVHEGTGQDIDVTERTHTHKPSIGRCDADDKGYSNEHKDLQVLVNEGDAAAK